MTDDLFCGVVALTVLPPAFEKVANASLACWSQVRPQQGMGSSFSIEYAMLGGIDKRPGLGNRPFIYYDWLSGGWGGRYGKAQIEGPYLCASGNSRAVP